MWCGPGVRVCHASPGRSIQGTQVTRPIFGTSRWAILGAGCCLGAVLSGCAHSRETSLSRMWDIPPGVPVPAELMPDSPSKEPSDEAAPTAPVAQKKKSWTERAIPDRMLAAFSRRGTPLADPFLGEYPKYDPAAAALAESKSRAELERQAIPLPSAPAVAAVTDALGAPADVKNPLAIAGAEHQAGANPFNSLDRLKAAIDSDRKLINVRNGGVDADQFHRDQVDELMKQARQDLTDGRLAAALRSARQAESMATSLKLDFGESDETPMVLVQLIKEQLDTDISDLTSVPPEQSVESASKPGAPNFGAPDRAADGGTDPEPPGRAALDSLVADAGNEGGTPPFPSEGVEFLPPSPEQEVPPPQDVPAPEPMGIRGPDEVATVVGPFSELGERKEPLPRRIDLPPAGEVEQYADASASPFWPRVETENSPSEKESAVPQTADAGEPLPAAAPRNISWRESAEPVLRLNVREFPRPLLAALVIAGVWAGGFASLRAVGFLRALGRRLRG